MMLFDPFAPLLPRAGAFLAPVDAEGVDAGAITASMDNGVLSLLVPKPERLTPKTIQIGRTEQRELETGTA